MSYTFKTPNQLNKINSPNNNIKNINFYQICNFKNPNTNKYNLRKFSLMTSLNFQNSVSLEDLNDNESNVVHMKEYYVPEKSYKNFIDIIKDKPNYKLFSTYDLNNIEYPTMSDYLVSISDLSNNQSKCYGFAQVM